MGSAADLAEYLPRQRWFGGKGRSISRVQIVDRVPLEAEGSATLDVCRVQYADGGTETYAVLTPLEGTRGIVSLLGVFIRSGQIRSRQGGYIECHDIPEGSRRELATLIDEVQLLGAEQSNTSVRVGRRFVFKLLRRIETGENPEVEIGRALSGRIAAVPALEGVMSYVSPQGEMSTLAVLQAWIDNEGDGWTYVLNALREAPGTDARDLSRNVTVLARVTAEFHHALETDAFGEAFTPEPVSRADTRDWLASLELRRTRAIELLESQGAGWPPELRALATAATRVLSSSIGLQVPSGLFNKIRIHGDYHLGQTLKTASGFAIIDLEGEPATPLEIRRRKSCALKDVAGLYRSFDYALETIAAANASIRERHFDLRSTFLENYLREAARLGSTSIPADRSDTVSCLRVFVLEKALYELEYEINNRPDWVPIPLRGIIAYA